MMSCSLAGSAWSRARLRRDARSSRAAAWPRSPAPGRRRPRERSARASQGAMSSGSCLASRRARRSRSVTSRSMRALWRAMISRKLPRLLRIRRLVEQRLDVAADRRQRRAQLVRDVGDEVTADLVGPPQIGDVVQDQHRAAAAARPTPARRARRTAARQSRPSGSSCGSDVARPAAPPSAAPRCRDAGSPRGSGRPTADASTCSISCAARFTSCTRPCRSRRARLRPCQRGSLPSARGRATAPRAGVRVLHGRIEHARHRRRARRCRSRGSGGSRSPSLYRRATAAIACTRRLSSAETARRAAPRPARPARTPAARPRPRAAPARRPPSAAAPRARTRLGMLRRHGGVQHVALNRRAVALDDARPARRAPACTSGRSRWLSSVASARPSTLESPTTRPSPAISVTRPSIACARRSASSSMPAPVDAGILRQQLGDEQRLVAEPPLDERRALRCRSSHAMMTVASSERRRRDAERGREDLGAEAEAHDTSSSTSL